MEVWRNENKCWCRKCGYCGEVITYGRQVTFSSAMKFAANNTKCRSCFDKTKIEEWAKTAEFQEGWLWKGENNRWHRKCPSCGVTIPYGPSASSTMLYGLVKSKSVCRNCDVKRRKNNVKNDERVWKDENGQWCRKCPDCGDTIKYSKSTTYKCVYDLMIKKAPCKSHGKNLSEVIDTKCPFCGTIKPQMSTNKGKMVFCFHCEQLFPFDNNILL